MKLIVAPLLAALVMTAGLSAGAAQTVYRCGSAYSQVPCPEAKVVEVGDARSPAQQAQARRVADDERRLAAEMRRERLVDERSWRGGAAASLSGQTATKVAVIVVPAQRKKRRAFGPGLPGTDFIAYDPSSRKPRRND